ncbi:BTAD domain-containing putative transcriptional regulator [Nocardia sp. NPDC051570]|uniref:AfsR/SARP family transcriptional regulator n=1 Tax=Nocardia sp. NPDC051570 TaxID=3364324 RepID=UPI0037897249
MHVLGPVLVRADGRQIAVDRPLERAVLVRLGLARGTPVADGRMAVDLWGDGDVNRPIPRLRVLISRLRAALGDHANAVLRSPAGYRVNIVVADLAAAEAAADRMHAARRAGRHEEVRAAAREALAQWRGPALADLIAVPFARAEAARLEEWRLGLTVTGLDAAVRLGADAEVIAQLATLVAEHPLHEPLARLHAIAVYRTGSQADALERLQRLRRTLSEELGVDPAPETAELELRILRHDSSLRAAPGRSEWPNLSAALENSAGTPCAHTGPRLATTLHEPWLVRSWYQEVRRHFRALIDAPGATPAERANALSRHAFHVLMTGGLDAAADLLGEAAELARGAGDEALLLGVRYYQGIVDIERGRLRTAIATLETGELLAGRLGDKTRMSAFATIRLQAVREWLACDESFAALGG